MRDNRQPVSFSLLFSLHQQPTRPESKIHKQKHLFNTCRIANEQVGFNKDNRLIFRTQKGGFGIPIKIKVAQLVWGGLLNVYFNTVTGNLEINKPELSRHGPASDNRKQHEMSDFIFTPKPVFDPSLSSRCDESATGGCLLSLD